jgi:hypothetical protein
MYSVWLDDAVDICNIPSPQPEWRHNNEERCMSARPTARLLAACGLAAALGAAATPFTPGNIVVYRVGDGTTSLVATGNPVFLDEFTVAGAKVQSVALPRTGAGAQRALVASGTATTDGLMTRSEDGHCLVVPGYGRDLGTGSGNLATTGVQANGAAIPRVIGRVSPAGGIDTSTALTDASVQSNFRGAASSDCNVLWASGTAATIGGGVRATTLGATTSSDLTGGSFANTRAVVAQGGQLYVSASVTALRTVASVGAGEPVAGTQAVAKLPGLPDPVAAGQPYAFFFAQLDPASGGLDTLYVADESFGVQKFSRVGSTWSANGAVGVGADAYRGITGTISGSTVTLFATRKGGSTSAGGGELVAIVDASGFNGILSGVPVPIATAAANTAFRGVAMAPVAPPPPSFSVTPSAGANGSISPITPQSALQGTSLAFTVTPAAGFSASVGGTCGGALNGTQYTTAPITANCTVAATFVPLPRYTVTPSFGPNGTVTPADGLSIVGGDRASFVVTPAPGYNAAVRGTCGGQFTGNTYVTKAIGADCTVVVVFAQKLVLFVGNSYTFGRVDPVMSYNAANVSDLTNDMWLLNPAGTNEDEPHPWGGIPGVFKKLTQQAGLDWDVSISARNAASLRGHYLNSNPAGWDLRGNIASQRFDTVVLQDLSDEPLPAGRGANANLPYFNAYVDKLETWVHLGNAESYTESQLFGGTTAACQAATGASASACNTLREIPVANPHARGVAEVYLYQTWARPDMIGPNGTNESGQFYSAAEGLEAMTRDFHEAYFGRAAANGRIEDVAPVGDAFLRAVQDGVAMRDPYVPEAGKVNLWHTDYFHPSKYGSYLSALVHFATLTGINPLTLGPAEQAAADLGIAPEVAVQLQKVAQSTVSPDLVAPTSSVTVSEEANAAGWNRGDVTLTFAAADTGGSLLDGVHYTLSGAQAGSGNFGATGSLTIGAEGTTTITWSAIDRAGNVEAAHVLVIRIDRTPPAITGLPSACSVWPPNNRMVEVATVRATDGVSGIATFAVTVGNNETGAADAVVTATGNARTVAVKATRDGNGSGRTYTIAATASDVAGNTASATAMCTVPHDR